MRFGILDNSRIFVVFSTKDTTIQIMNRIYYAVLTSIIFKDKSCSNSVWAVQFVLDGVLGRTKQKANSFLIINNSNFIQMFQTKNMKFAENAQGADNARTSQRKRGIPSLSLKRQLKHLKTIIQTERSHKLRAYSFILDNSIFDCYSHYCMTTLPDSIPDEFIEIMDIMSLKTDPTLLKNDALWKS